MSDITTIASTDLVSSSRAVINANIQYLQEHFKSATAPASPRAGQFWLEDDNPSATVWTLWVYDGTSWIEVLRIDTTNNVTQTPSGLKVTGAIDANSFQIDNLANGTASGDAVNKGQVDARIMTIPVYLGSQSASFDRFVIFAHSTMTIVNAYITAGTTISADGANYWTFQLRNVTAAVNLFATAPSTAGTAITADTLRTLAPNQNLSPTNGDVIQLQVTKTGTPTALDAEAVLWVTFKVTT